MDDEQPVMAAHTATHLVLLEEGLAVSGTPHLHFRFKMHQAEVLVLPEITSEPAGHLLATLAPLDVISKQPSKKKNDVKPEMTEIVKL